MTKIGSPLVASRLAFILACAAGLCLAGAIPVALADTERNTQDPLDRTVNFSIPAESLGLALVHFSEQAGVQVLVDAGSVSDRVTSGLQGVMRASEGLRTLLRGSGLTYQIQNHTVTVTPARAPGSETQKSLSHEPTDSAGAHPAGEAAEGPLPRHRSQDQDTMRQGAVTLSEVVVTGSHIRGEDASSPVITIDTQDIERSGYTNVGDVLRSLPENFSGGNNPGVMTGSVPGSNNLSIGGSAPNLRGLGAGSTLTLVNGHRLAENTINGAVDILAIPLGAVERVEVLTDGASAVYGSDAVAGVVNFILKKNYDGARTSVTVGGTSDGGGFETKVGQLVGKTWGSGGALVSYEYDKQGTIYNYQRDFSSSAPTPTIILPGITRNSAYVSANEAFGRGVTGSLDVLFSEGITYAPATRDLVTVPYADTSRQYSINPSVSAALSGDWTATVGGGFNRNRVYESTGGVYSSGTDDGRSNSVELGADGPLLSVPAGQVRAAVGAGHRKEDYSATEFVTASRTVNYGYAELAIPLLAADQQRLPLLEGNVSGRYEHYADAGTKTVPKLGLIYRPVASLALRGSWGGSFRAPPLAQKFAPLYLYLLDLPDTHSPSGSSPALEQDGGNPSLRPETGKVWNVSVDFHPEWRAGFAARVSYFNITYTNRLAQLPTDETALTDPTLASFVVRNPSLALQQSLLAASVPTGGLINLTGAPYDPSAVAAVVNDTVLNISSQDADGVDATLQDHFAVGPASVETFLNGTYLSLRERFSPLSPEMTLSGTAFNPPKFRTRAGVSGSLGPWSATAIVNYLGSETNTYLPSRPAVASWTTVDLQMAYAPQWSGWASGFTFTLSGQNIFDRSPPYLLFDAQVPGFHYDPTNVSPLGRAGRIQVVKNW